MRLDDVKERSTPLLASGDPDERRSFALGGPDRGVGTGSGTPNRTGGGYGTGDPDSGRQQGNNPDRRDPDSSEPSEPPRRDPDTGSQRGGSGGRGNTNK